MVRFYFTKGIFCLFALLVLGKCETGSNSSGEEAAALLLLASSNTGTTTNSTDCPPATLPTDVLIADTVTSAPGSDANTEFKDPSKAINGVCGKGEDAGSLDIYELPSTTDNGYIILEWNSKKVKNSSGVDFVVFENAFKNASSGTYFVEPIIVEVSNDLSKWCGWSPDYKNSDETAYSGVINYWGNFAGLTPVKYNMTTNPLSASEVFDSDLAGGDGFDLDNLSSTNNSASGTNCDSTEVSDIKSNGFIYLKLTNAATRTNPDTGSTFPQDGSSTGRGPDIDGVVAKEVVAR
ncbi:MAG: LIC_13355 family lipoprotein [Leptospiraceae bacterium]|nr:LIC_13355 family lipoprotein [Leptospiraceae bacterium]MCP5498135.1 LIC_13355 family lipoprotein [Leptospiraceae bacterium]